MLLVNWWERLKLSRFLGKSSNSAQLSLQGGIDFYDQKEYSEAVNSFTHTIYLKADYAEAYVYRARAYVKLGKYLRAWQDCDRALKFNDKDAMTYATRAGAHFKLKNYDQALQDGDRAIELNPHLTKAYYYRGLTRCQLKQYDTAVADFSHVIRANPYLTKAYYNRGVAKFYSGNIGGAIEDYYNTISLDEKYANAYYNRGLAYAKLGKKLEAFSDWRRAADLFLIKGQTAAYHKAIKLMRSSTSAKKKPRKQNQYVIERGVEKIEMADIPSGLLN